MKSWSENVSPEMKYDARLVRKKVDEGFLTEDDYKKYAAELEAEADYDFTSAEALDADDGSEDTAPQAEPAHAPAPTTPDLPSY